MAQNTIVPSTAKGILSNRALDILNRASEIKSEIDFCSQGGGLHKEIRNFMEWLGDHLRSELQREDWEEPRVRTDEDGVCLYLSSPKWRVGPDEYVAFTFYWPIGSTSDHPPAVILFVPAQDRFPSRNELLNRLRPKLKRSGFTEYYEYGDTDPAYPIWKNIRLPEFHTELGFDLDSFVVAIGDGFRRLIEVEQLIEDAFQSLTPPPPSLQSERALKTIAFLDTECEGPGNARRMTQLAIVNAAYDAEGDAVVGILEEYFMDAGQTLDKPRVREALERADFIVAHNANFDSSLLARDLPGTEKLKWLCSFRGIAWKPLLGVQSASLETLMGKTGLKYTQDHNARSDASDLKHLLSLKREGRTYLKRLLDNVQAEGEGVGIVSPDVIPDQSCA